MSGPRWGAPARCRVRAPRAVRLGLVCCARHSVAPLGVYRALAEREVDLVVHLGDYIYEDEGDKGPRDHEPPHTARHARRLPASHRPDPSRPGHPVTAPPPPGHDDLGRPRPQRQRLADRREAPRPRTGRSMGRPGAGRRAGSARVVARPLGRPVRSARHLAFAGGGRPRRADPPRHPLHRTGPPGRRRRGPTAGRPGPLPARRRATRLAGGAAARGRAAVGRGVQRRRRQRAGAALAASARAGQPGAAERLRGARRPGPAR